MSKCSVTTQRQKFLLAGSFYSMEAVLTYFITINLLVTSLKVPGFYVRTKSILPWPDSIYDKYILNNLLLIFM